MELGANSPLPGGSPAVFRLDAGRGAEQGIGGRRLAAKRFVDPTAGDEAGGRLQERPVAGAGIPAGLLVAKIMGPAGGIESVLGLFPVDVTQPAPIAVKEGWSRRAGRVGLLGGSRRLCGEGRCEKEQANAKNCRSATQPGHKGLRSDGLML